jgi:hypothetical protein
VLEKKKENEVKSKRLKEERREASHTIDLNIQFTN